MSGDGAEPQGYVCLPHSEPSSVAKLLIKVNARENLYQPHESLQPNRSNLDRVRDASYAGGRFQEEFVAVVCKRCVGKRRGSIELWKRRVAFATEAVLGSGCCRDTRARESPRRSSPTQAGPYLAHLLAGGPALVKPLPKELAGTVARTEELWVRTDTPDADALIAGIGDPNSSSCYFELRHGHPGVGSGFGRIAACDSDPVSEGVASAGSQR